MELWIALWILIEGLRPAFARTRTFMWFCMAVAAICTRTDMRGVTSMVRALGLKESRYDCLLDFFHSDAVNLDRLTSLWTSTVLRVLSSFLLVVNGRIVLLADGIKAPKTGRKMPAVKKLHQESQNNSKPEFIFGHSCQAIALVVRAASSYFALPLTCRIHEGVVFSNRDKRSLLDKLVALLFSLKIEQPAYLVADAYYSSAKVIGPMLMAGHHLVSCVRITAVAYKPAESSSKNKRGRPRQFGEKVLLRSVFNDASEFVRAESPIYGERNIDLKYRSIDLLWRPARCLVRFVWVVHPTRGSRIFMCTDLNLEPLDIISLYGVRFKIEVSFKQAIHTVGVYAYHFWMSSMTPRSTRSGNQHLHHKDDKYRDNVRRKIRAYHVHIQTGLIAQCILQILSTTKPSVVWSEFGSWIRTSRPGIPPSESIVSTSLRNSLPDFLSTCPKNHAFAKFLSSNIDINRAEGARLVA